MTANRKHIFKVIILTSATILFLYAIVGGQQYISTKVSPIWTFIIELIAGLSSCFIYYLFFGFFKQYPDKLQVALTKYIFIGKAYLAFSLFLCWTEILAFSVVEGIAVFLVLITEIIWCCRLFLNDGSDNNSYKAIKLYATFSLLAAFCSLAIGANLVYSTNIQGNIMAGRTFIYWIPQLVLALPNLILFKFILSYTPNTASELRIHE